MQTSLPNLSLQSVRFLEDQGLNHSHWKYIGKVETFHRDGKYFTVFRIKWYGFWKFLRFVKVHPWEGEPIHIVFKYGRGAK